MAKCMKCGGMKTTKMKKMQNGGMKTTVGNKDAKTFIAGIPNSGPTGPNYQGIDTMKKGGAKKSLSKAQMGKAIRSIDTNEYGSTGEVEKTNKKGATKVKTVEISNTGSSMTTPSSTPTARIDKSKYDKEGMSTKRTTKDISVKRAQRMINKIGSKATMKKGGTTKKMAKGGSSFGMLSVKAGIDNNPKPTAADRIAGAKMSSPKKAKFGASVKVQRSPKAGKVTAVGRGYAAVGKREPGRIINKTIGKKK